MPKFIIFALLGIIIASTNLFSQATYTYNVTNNYNVGKSPMKVIKLEGSTKVHIICAGEDLNYDNVIDEGDEAPSWWIIDSPDAGIARKVIDFDKFLKFQQFRPALDPTSNILYVPLVGKIVSISLDDEAIDDDMVTAIDAQSISYAGGHLLISVSPALGEIGKVEVFNLQTGQILQTVTGGKNISDCIYYPSQQGISIAILNQGDFGSENSTVMYGAINHMFDFSIEDEAIVGDAANHILFNNGKLYVTVAMSHCIKVIDVTTHEIQTWNTGTTDWDSPRESVIHGDYLFVTTYSGDVRIFDINTGLLLDIFSYNSDKIESMEFYDDNSFFTANTYDEFYAPNNQIFFWSKEPFIFPGMVKELTVGKSPVGLILDPTGRLLNVFCMGDTESNENPSWWTITRHNMADFVVEKRYEFDADDIKFPFLPAVDFQLRTLYVPANGAIKSFNLDDFTIEDDYVAGLNAVALDMAGGHLMAAVRYPNESDSIVVINLQTGAVLQKVYAGENVLDLKYFPLFQEGSQQPIISLAILTNDSEEDENSKLLYGPISHMSAFSLENEVSVGVGATNIALGLNNMIGVASHFSDDLFVLNAGNNSISNIKLGTQGSPFGPLSLSSINGLGFAVGTGAGYLTVVAAESNDFSDEYMLQLNAMLPVGMLAASSVVEIDFQSFDSFIAVTGHKDMSDNIGDKVVIFTTGLTSVRDYTNGDIASVKIYPNPATELINVEAQLRESPSSEIALEIYSITGVSIAKVNVPATSNINHTFDLRNLGLTSGTYILHILNGNEVKAVPFNVVK